MKTYLENIKTEINNFIDDIDVDAINAAVQLINEAKKNNNRLHMSGIGKPSYVAAYGASLISSTGTPAYVLDGTEAVHGSSGQLVEGDVVICISNSGETQELLATAHAILNNGCKIIAITSNPESSLAKLAEIHIQAKVEQEGGPLNRAPRSSIIAELIVVQQLSVELQESCDLSVKEYLQRHPGGSLGKLRENEKI
ncbi:SIS domain-containing protein [Fastidiosipila sanguinis]|uniref:Carbohydrate isomerase n=1 Tax=Fastidiosipila sanguinis TaxID=236753 RepID=A0A2S0KPI9_9FIRM|nr:SIS domain-containing protein [Fastidiosipila sanguinis]AVM42946.1 carbohydrate isomerase [Fastidiosipila sanguinis]